MNPQQLSDNELVSHIKLNGPLASLSLKELAIRHSGLFHKILNAYVPNDSKVCNKEDLTKEKIYQLYSSALKFDFDKKVKFSTFFGNEVKWLCLNCYNKSTRENQFPAEECYLDLLSQNKDEDERFISIESLKRIYEVVKHHPDKRVDKIFRLRYNEGKGNKVMSWKEVSKQVDLSIQGCINVHNAAIKHIKNKFKKESNE
tara:strand:- start:203 stop:805 length:603 start_codon:yes stop_codon:yes gene_type:complete